MSKRIISVSHKMKNASLDDVYTLFEDGTILHNYDKHIYKGGQNLEEVLTVDDLSKEVKQRLLDSASDENKELVRKILKLESE